MAENTTLPDKPRGTGYYDDTAISGASYGGIPILADDADVHAEALNLLRAHVPACDGILDIGAGEGAFSKRLVDNGFTGVEALELRSEAFRVAGVPVHGVNLDGNWAGELPRQYNGAVALEIIEHLENPWHFARQCAAALRPGGVVVLSTPNIESSRSRIEFLLRAEFRFFGQRDYERIGHITSMTAAQIVRVFAQAGLELAGQSHSRHKGVWKPTNPKRFLRSCLYLLSYPFMRGARKGEISLFAFRQPA
jgi:cyclopropane fatty-acyl-phospholipid synthase-like methyltransferase